jgi:SAM-dependent methyltransferase
MQSGHPPGHSSGARRWADALASWAIPDDILASAPEDPWALPVGLFRVDVSDPPAPSSPSLRRASEALAGGGRVLDVGCGGGAASIPLAGLATDLVGVDVEPGMLESFAAAAGAAGIVHHEIQGRWPDVGHETPIADVVVCHHVVYNVADIVPFLNALSAHARRRVVVELTDRHPQSALNALWRRFWDLERPGEPTAELFVEVATEAGVHPKVDRFERPPRKALGDRAAYVEFVRRRLCLGPERDAEIDAVLPEQSGLTPNRLATVYWDLSSTG